MESAPQCFRPAFLPADSQPDYGEFRYEVARGDVIYVMGEFEDVARFAREYGNGR